MEGNGRGLIFGIWHLFDGLKKTTITSVRIDILGAKT
jgi:hypothetical protein